MDINRKRRSERMVNTVAQNKKTGLKDNGQKKGLGQPLTAGSF